MQVSRRLAPEVADGPRSKIMTKEAPTPCWVANWWCSSSCPLSSNVSVLPGTGASLLINNAPPPLPTGSTAAAYRPPAARPAHQGSPAHTGLCGLGSSSPGDNRFQVPIEGCPDQVRDGTGR